ncbi:type II toxin-antitoxin system RelE/ParE family toxin [Hyphomicrobium sp. B1]|uniref:type II toxin-antitoxin system RelE/ParE family toxin n=1 Tax=unclassified Hyphomicrobium TaxID=2619925 RepID=UPI00391B7CFB
MTSAYRTGKTRKGWQKVSAIAERTLGQLAAAKHLADMGVPPGNRLELLTGDREGQHSIRMHIRWRVCFKWTDAGPNEVEITDYR